MLEYLETLRVGKYRLDAVACLKLKRMLVFDEKQQQSVVFAFVTYTPFIE